jgi:hypothetical protein
MAALSGKPNHLGMGYAPAQNTANDALNRKSFLKNLFCTYFIGQPKRRR